MKKPLSEKQLAASRINGRKSKGPNTPRGKSVSSRNAIKHGFLSRSVLISGELPERFLHLKNAYIQSFQPETQDEYDLIDNLAVNRWRLLRNWNFESASLIHEQRQQAELNVTEDPPTRAMFAQRALDNPPRSQEALSRHEVRLDRQYHKALDRLHRLRSERHERQRRENEKNAKRPHHLEQNDTFCSGQYSIEKPKEPQIHPGENPIDPAENPRAA